MSRHRASSLARGFGYAAEALRLLRRRPGLLALPLLAVCFNVLEGTAARQALVTYTTVGRALVADARAWATDSEARRGLERPELALDELARQTASSALREIASPVPAPGLTGTAELVFMTATPTPDPEDSLWVGGAENTAISILLMLPLQALFLAFYYERLRTAVDPSAEALAFRLAVRRSYWRFLAILVLLSVLSAGLELACSSLAPALLFGPLWPGDVLLLPFALTLVAIVQDRVGLFQAVRSSAFTVFRQFPTAVVLLVLACLLMAGVHTLRAAAGLWLDILPDAVYLATPSPRAVAVQVVCNGLLAAVGVWLALAQFLWYRSNLGTAAEIPGAVQDCG
jgi:hypothetical protein